MPPDNKPVRKLRKETLKTVTKKLSMPILKKLNKTRLTSKENHRKSGGFFVEKTLRQMTQECVVLNFMTCLSLAKKKPLYAA